ncbi:MAG: protein-L-isoaspartate(D-aspartate) O-methyltransferase, partial [Pseudomonadota bacterium]
RRDFIRPEFLSDVWSKGTIPIDCGESIEGPDTQARLIRHLGIEEDHRVLEIGTGSGFTAAVMSKLAKRVFTIERYRTLSAAAAARIRELKIDNAIASHGDGSRGGTDGPFDRIISWAAFDNVPRPFIEQLTSGGVMICPIGEADMPQDIVRLTKVGSRFERQDIGKVRAQPLNLKIPDFL